MNGVPDTRRLFRLGVLISGRGSNLQAIIDATKRDDFGAEVSVVISNRSDAPGLARAHAAGLETIVVDAHDHIDRDAYDRTLADLLHDRRIDLICLAGYMRLVGAPLLHAFSNRILNIHPSLLPAFPGLGAQRQALAHGVRVSGCTVHLVTHELDNGPIILQAVVPVLNDDTVETLSARILEEEHRIYPEAIRTVLRGGWRIEGRRFVASNELLANPDVRGDIGNRATPRKGV